MFLDNTITDSYSKTKGSLYGHGGKDGVQSPECGVRSAESGVQSAESGVRSPECEVQRAECGVRS